MADEPQYLDHLYISGHAASERFRRSGGGKAKVQSVGRRRHGRKLKSEAGQAFATFDAERDLLNLSDVELRALGTIVVLEGSPGTDYPLKVESLTSRTSHRERRPRWILLSVHPATPDTPEQATVWVADAYRQQFLKLFQDYLDAETSQGNPKNRELVANISRIRRAVLDDLWTSAGTPPQHGTTWWEIWLDATSEHAQDLDRFVEANGLRSLHRSILLRDRVVVWVQATWQQLELLTYTRIPVAEIRSPEFIDTVEDLSADETIEYVQDLASRVTAAPHDAPAVCHLDTGVLRSHVLLRDSLSEDDHHTILGTSGTDVHPSGHGTSMAGLALFGNLEPHLTGNSVIRLQHRLESVRMAPAPHERAIAPIDFGSATVQAVTLPEITNPRRRVFCLTLSTQPDNPGEPTLWSAAVDALAVGSDSTHVGEQFRLLSAPDPDAARLIIVAAGNVDRYDLDHRVNSDTSAIEDPGQAWNALTVGAYTDLTATPAHPQYDGWTVMAGAGQLSPHSRTSVMFNQRKWPIKPDICVEGGNVLTDGAQTFEPRHALLSLRTTGHAHDSALTSANATSAATAQASRLASLAMCRYPDYWPETVRGLLPHCAEWTSAMSEEVKADQLKNARLQLLRRYGWGVPTEDAVLNSTRRAVTMVTQDQFVPFEGDDYTMRQFRLHTLPWPADALRAIAAADVRLRITLSYFIEPSASRRGWRRRYAYPSHSLRFDLQGPLEKRSDFIARINRDAQSDEDGAPRTSPKSDRWLLGEQQRCFGSLHQDEWHGLASELAECNSIAVYPVGGWWKNSKSPDRRDNAVRYALLISLTTTEQHIDLYTPIETQLHIPVITPIATN
ncbi:S8 family peptidase [Nocardia wallacei]|uniref:S8 family peptidase n=1 Tax=Nocardia wallacei TaxID=480035 RepID=UPI003CC7E5AB